MNRSALLACVALVFAGCEVSTGHGDDYQDSTVPPPRSGSVGNVSGGEADLSVEWTIEGSHDPGACDDYDADHASISIEDEVGVVDEVDVPCEAFGYDAPPLPAGTYWATIVLRDARNHDLTDEAETEERDLPPGASDYVSVDFSEDSFL
jgi:hypothetical protein